MQFNLDYGRMKPHQRKKLGTNIYEGMKSLAFSTLNESNMDRKLDIKKGDIVFVKTSGGSNASRYYKPFSPETWDEWVREEEVISIGKKYVTVGGKEKWIKTRYVIENDYKEYYTCGTSNSKLYVSRQEIIDKWEYVSLNNFIKKSLITTPRDII